MNTDNKEDVGSLWLLRRQKIRVIRVIRGSL
jgi:hypothetical protein